MNPQNQLYKLGAVTFGGADGNIAKLAGELVWCHIVEENIAVGTEHHGGEEQLVAKRFVGKLFGDILSRKQTCHGDRLTEKVIDDPVNMHGQPVHTRLQGFAKRGDVVPCAMSFQ